MAVRTLTIDTGQPLALVLRAGYAKLSLRVVKDAGKSEIVLKGAQEILDKVTADQRAQTWTVRIPNEGGGPSIQFNNFGPGGYSSTVIRGSGRSTIITGGDMVIGNVRGGRVTVDGVDVTGYVNEQRGAGMADAELTAEVLLPGGSTADLKVDEGEVKVWGELDAQVETRNADVVVGGLLKSGTIKTYNGSMHVYAAGEVGLETHNGSIDLDSARGQTMVTTHNGNARVHADADITVMATSHNGNVDVTKAPGTHPRVMATSHNGRVRKP